MAKVKQQGIVKSQICITSLTTSILTLETPYANPTPMMDPTSVWVGDIGIPLYTKSAYIIAAEIWAENDLLGTNSVIRLPIVSLTLLPAINIPTMSIMAPIIFISNPACPNVMYKTLVAIEISIAPILRAVAQEVNIKDI